MYSLPIIDAICTAVARWFHGLLNIEEEMGKLLKRVNYRVFLQTQTMFWSVRILSATFYNAALFNSNYKTSSFVG